jgi:spermidine synthase
MTHEASMPEKRWLPETLFDDLGFRMSYAVEKVLYEQHTDHQHLVLFEHKHFGKMLMLDGATQVTTRDEFIYHEMMTHVPILAHGKARNVLIIGGGDCGIAEEVLKHKALKSVVQVEIDASVIEFSKEHFPEFTKPVFRDKRFESVIADGMKYVATAERRFDIIIVDSTDPQGPGAVLFTKEFYAACKRCMAPGGVMVTQNGVPFLQPDELISSVGMFKSCSRTPPVMLRRFRPMWAATWRWAGHQTTRCCAGIRFARSPRGTDEPAASRRNTGRRRCTSPLSRCRALSRSMSRARGRVSCHSGARRRREPGIHRRELSSISRPVPHRLSCGYGFRARRCAAPRNDHHSPVFTNNLSALPCAMRPACSSGSCASQPR